MSGARQGTPAARLAALLREVRRIHLRCDRLVADEFAGGYRTAFRGAGVEFDEVREYVPGDDPRDVDWNVTARTGRPHVKKYVDERERSLLFLLDLSPSMHAGFGAWSPRDAAVRFCALLTAAALRHDDRVGLAAFGSEVLRWVPPRKGQRHAMQVLRDALGWPAAPAGTGSALDAALGRAASSLRRRTTVFVLSDFFAEGWEEALRRCRARHDVVAVPIRSPECDEPPTGLIRLADPETGRARVLDLADARVRAAWGARIAEQRARLDAQLDAARVARIDLAPGREADLDALVGPVQAFFRTRRRRAFRA